MCSPLLLPQRPPACLVFLIWMVLEMEGRWPYSYFFWSLLPGFIQYGSYLFLHALCQRIYIYIYIYICVLLIKWTFSSFDNIIFSSLQTYLQTYIIIIIIIKSRYQHHIPWLSHAVHLYHPLLLAGFLGCLLCLHRANVRKSLLVSQHRDIHVEESIKERSLCKIEVLALYGR